MPDQIRHDALSGLNIQRPRDAQAGQAVIFNGSGFSVSSSASSSAPSPAAIQAVRTAVPASLAEGVLNFAYSTSNNTSIEFPTRARLLGLSLSRQTALSAGTVTLQAQRSGSNVVGGLGTFTSLPDSIWFGPNGYIYEQGETLGLVLSTSSDFSPTNQVMVATAWVALLP